MADVWTENYKRLREKLLADRGPGPLSPSTGATLPRIIVGDALIALAPYTGAVMAYVERRGAPLWKREAGPMGTGIPVAVSVRQYLETPATPGRAELRGGILPAWSHAHESSGPDIMARWQAAVNAVGAALVWPMPNPGRAMTDSEIIDFFSKLFAIGVSLDVAGETPDVSTWERVWGATKFAASRSVQVSAELAGAAVAWTADQAGKAAGGLASGFFEAAGLGTLAVVAVAVYVSIQVV